MKMQITLLAASLIALLPLSPTMTLAADDGAKIYASVCSECHTPKKQPLDKVNLSRAEWSDAIERMVSYGADIPKGKLPDLLDYLVTSHGASGKSDSGKK